MCPRLSGAIVMVGDNEGQSQAGGIHLGKMKCIWEEWGERERP